MKKLSLLALLVGVAASLPAHATSYNDANSTYSYGSTNSNTAPSTSSTDYINASFGDYDFDKGGGRGATDFRLEYQWGADLIPLMDPQWSTNWLILNPVAGFEGTSDGMTFFNGGLNLDVPLGDKVIFTWGEAIGWYGHGDSRQALGSGFEMRSQLELGWKFDNNMRLSGYISHLSNAGVGDSDPGAEILGAYLRVPVGWLAH